ncbi:MAG: hypothetical protein FJZ56_06050 [Chlamydiae bacterium]|nr:hypothetical protein [Chlamydiota bacterium]
MAIFLIFALIFCFSIVYSSLRIGISPMPTSKKVSKAIKDLFPRNYKGRIYDLGSGFGTMLIFFASQYPQAEIIGYELSFFPFWISKLLCRRYKNITIFKKDFRGEKLKQGWIYLFLFSKGTRSLDCAQFQGSVVLSNTFQLASQYTKKMDVADLYRSSLYLYDFKKNGSLF